MRVVEEHDAVLHHEPDQQDEPHRRRDVQVGAGQQQQRERAGERQRRGEQDQHRRKKAANGSDVTDRVMKLLIQLRADARTNKNFALADAIRKGLTDIGITLEDRADGTIWRKE